MDINEILSHCDHTNLKQTAVPDDIKRLIDEAVEYKTASVCIPPCYVKLASEYAAGKTRICTVVGFPNGYNTTEVKAFETKQALLDGADEIDMVINIGALKSGNTDYVENEIKTLKEVCGDKCLKVIIETCLLTEDEKKIMCDIVSRSKADYIKTSTGFSDAGATHNDIRLFKKYVSPSVKIKAAGGIHTLEDAAEFLSEGADRLGASALVSLAKSALEKTDY